MVSTETLGVRKRDLAEGRWAGSAGDGSERNQGTGMGKAASEVLTDPQGRFQQNTHLMR